VEGYGILQPRVSVSLPGADRSPYVRLYGGEVGIDPYTRTVSDVYQDVFQEGSFIGKGIYDLRMFERVLKGRFPEGQILSHDLLEGCYLRSGLLSDVQLYEEYPSATRPIWAAGTVGSVEIGNWPDGFSRACAVRTGTGTKIHSPDYRSGSYLII